MAKIYNSDYIASIEQSASIISTEFGSRVVEYVFERYGAHGIEDLNSSYLPDVFSELYAIETDLR
ncbi:MAG: hypothetical protein IJ583_05535 [Firmicutes bacterium]|nr:hypothetical protein [Bacillota bacterium]